MPLGSRTRARREQKRRERLNRLGAAIDDRFVAADYGKKVIYKAFPDHWSFFLGELALYSFIVLLLTGTWLALFFKPSMTEIVYHGSYVKLDGIKMSEAYASAVNISFDIRGGLLIRQIHHWAALVFVGSIALHLLRIFFTGAFRKPREVNWIIGTVMFALAAAEGFAGYSLPDDLLSGTGVRIADGIMMSIPVVGTYISFFVFGGQYPGEAFIPRLYLVHVLLLPGLLLALITAHLMILWHQGHTQWPGKKERDTNEVGDPLFPHFMMKTTSLFFFVFGILAVLGTMAQINPIWLFGPYNPVISSNGSQPDWYIGFLEGALRLMPGVESNVWGHTFIWNVFIPAVLLPALFFLFMGGYPYFEQWVTGDRRRHQVIDRPRNMPARTALGAAIMAMGADIQLAGADDVLSYYLRLSDELLVWFLRIGFFVFPVLAYVVTWRVCLALQRSDRRRLRLGKITGVSVVSGDSATRPSPDGARGMGYAPVSQPEDEEHVAVLRTRRPDELLIPTPRHLVPLPTPRRAAALLRARLNHLYVVSRLEPAELDGSSPPDEEDVTPGPGA